MKKAFERSELKVIGQFPVVATDTYMDPNYLTDKLATPITPRENFELFFNRQDPLWIPDLWVDTNYLYPAVIPDCVACSKTGGLDAFGSVWIPDKNCPELPAFPEPGNYVLKDITDWEDLKWPNPSDWDWDKAAEEHKVVDPDRPNAVFLYSSLFERMVTLMGFENAAMALALEPESSHAFIDRLQDYNLDLIEHVHKYLNCDIIIMSDDWGSQRSPFFSVDMAEEFFAPHVKALTKRTHELGMRFMHHCCGNSTAFVPLMIDEGIDWWQYNYEAVQDNIEDAMKKYGDKILFDGYPGFVMPLSDDDEEFKRQAEMYYEKLTSDKRCSLSIMDTKERSFDVRSFCYELARKVCDK